MCVPAQALCRLAPRPTTAPGSPSLWLPEPLGGRSCRSPHWERQAVDMRSTRQLTSLEPGPITLPWGSEEAIGSCPSLPLLTCLLQSLFFNLSGSGRGQVLFLPRQPVTQQLQPVSLGTGGQPILRRQGSGWQLQLVSFCPGLPLCPAGVPEASVCLSPLSTLICLLFLNLL